MDDNAIVAALQEVGAGVNAVQLARVLEKHLGEPLTQAALISYFKRAFPSIPLRALLEAGAWQRVSGGSLSDEAFNELLAPWLHSRDG